MYNSPLEELCDERCVKFPRCFALPGRAWPVLFSQDLLSTAKGALASPVGSFRDREDKVRQLCLLLHVVMFPQGHHPQDYSILHGDDLSFSPLFFRHIRDI